MELREGEFVRVQDLDFGIGKLSRLGPSDADVSYFSCPARGEAHRVRVDRSLLQAIVLSSQTRVYWFDRDKAAWLVGRIAEDGRIEGAGSGHDEDRYLVELPNKRAAHVAVSVLQTRWDRPVDDPVAYLAARTTETPFWHLGRREFLRQAVEQRAMCGSMTGLWSAAVDLQAHQWRAVRTVLADPVQRYLLADEVGLGKTIEAGAILRQYVLDHPVGHSATVVAPVHLLAQWRDELRQRFYLGRELDQSIVVVSLDDALSSSHATREIGLLIIDEAHHPAAMAFSQDPAKRAKYSALAAMAHRSVRLLLLSATPVLRNEDGFLAMLHLLDGNAYPLRNREAFRHKVENRQRLAESLSDLQTDSTAFFLEDALDTLDTLTSPDPEAGRLIGQVRQRADQPAADPDRKRAILDLREHISEVYRLHRRMIRNRRETVRDVLRPRVGSTVVRVKDPVGLRSAELLERWREEANLAARGGGPGLGERARLYWLLLEALCSHPLVLRELVAARRTGGGPGSGRTPDTSTEYSLYIAEAFPGEAALLDAMLAAIDADVGPRATAVVEVVREAAKRGVKSVLFVDSPVVADLVAEAIAGPLAGATLRHRPGEDISAFLSDHGPVSVLVCDRAAEEGLNLQTVPAQAVHFDLPLDPGRVEQRLGRLDRFGARIPAKSIVFADQDPLIEAWRTCLQNVIRVFDRSVASLQYILEDHLQYLRSRAFEDGAEAIDVLVVRLTDPNVGLEAESRRIRTQEQLDAIAQASEDEAERFQILEDFDQEHEALQRGFDAWVVERLQFGVLQDPDPGVLRYNYARGSSRETLLPPEDFVRYCGTSVDPNAGRRSRATHRLAFNRNQALRKRAEVARIGHAFVDGLLDEARRDDRGAAFAMWRVRATQPLPAPTWVVFGFDYLVEAGPLPQAARLGLPPVAFRRRLDAVLSPRYVTVWVDQEMEVVQDSALLEVLGDPYRNGGEDRDYNLSTRWSLIETRRPAAWEELCSEAAARAAVVMAANVGLDDEILSAERAIDNRFQVVRAQLQARLSRHGGGSGANDEQVLAFETRVAEATKQAIRTPRVVPDSAFAVFLSNDNPFASASS